MKSIHLLFTSVGRRVELVQCFKEASIRLNFDLLIYGADMSDTAPALFFCDRQIKVPSISDTQYISDMLSICQREKIDYLVPTIDTDLLILSQNKQLFEAMGTQVIISEENMIRLCRDKRLTASFFNDCGLLSPMPIDEISKYSGGFPCFIKPMAGSSSINAHRVDSTEELAVHAEKISDYIIQPFIEGAEYTVDIFCDFSGNPIYITPRERMEVRSGEVIKTRICQDEKIIEECRSIISRFKPCGPLTVQLIRQRDSGDDYYIEINPRFGGGAPLSMKAGADGAEALLRLFTNENLEYIHHAAKKGSVYCRFDQSIHVSSDKYDMSDDPVQAVIFDLDDTLYSEKEYVRSGFRAVAGLLDDIVTDAENRLWEAFEEKKPAIDSLLAEIGRLDLKEVCIKAYRSHSPNIHLFVGVIDMLIDLRNKGIKLGVITDGWPLGQRAKIKALELEPLIDNYIITDELGGIQFRKPCDLAFRIMQRRFGVPYEKMMYIGDNVNKDFVAPTKLGMQTALMKSNDGIYEKHIQEGYFMLHSFNTIHELHSMINQRMHA